MARHIHIHVHDNAWSEASHPRAANGEFGQGPHNDPAMVNIPLSKRGDINAQLDKYKAEQAKAAHIEHKASSAKKKTDKQHAKELMAEHGAAIHAKMDAKFGHKELASILDQMVKWEPAKFLKFVEKFKAETAA